jgi:hypothetical protein
MNQGDKVILNLTNCTPKRKEELKRNVFGDARFLEGTIIECNVDKTYKVKWINSNKEIEYLMSGSELLPYFRFREGFESFQIYGLDGGKKARKLRKSRKVHKPRKTKKMRKSRRRRERR